MAAPTLPTTTAICQEAYRRFGLAGLAGTSSEVATAIAYGIEQVKKDIAAFNKRLRFLQKVAYASTAANVSKYPCPADSDKLVDLELLAGPSRGTAQSG